MFSQYIKKILTIEDVIVKKVIHKRFYVEFNIETKPSEHVFPAVGLVPSHLKKYS